MNKDMTRQEAIEALTSKEVHNPDIMLEALDMAVKALEQEPCKDAVSRQDVLNLAKKGVLISNGNYDSVCKAINELSSVIPKGVTVTDFADKCRECGREKVLDKITDEIEKLNYVDYGSMYSFESHQGAREMKADVLQIIDKYKAESEVPNCGAKMEQKIKMSFKIHSVDDFVKAYNEFTRECAKREEDE